MILFFFLFIPFLFCVGATNAYHAYDLQPGDLVEHTQQQDRFQIYCYAGKPKYIIHVWQTVLLQIDLKNDNYVIYDGGDASIVQKEYIEHRSSWSLNLFSWKQKQFKLDPFNRSCVGIDSMEKYNVHLNVIRIDYWKVLRLLVGVFIFISAQRLSRNNLFYYLCGITFGIFASFLILIYFISKLFPRKPMMYGVAVCGWTVGVYILQKLWENVRVILVSYQTHVAWYAFITGLISFIVCYRMGPVSNKRTLNLIQWTLQTAAALLIFFSSQFQEAAMGQLVILLFAYNFPMVWVTKSKSYWKRKFPPKLELMSNDDYYRQGVEETQKALAELRNYCSSPQCNQWKTVLKLKEAKRFASFIEGQSHLSDEEIIDYETSIQQTEFTDDEYTDED